MPLRLANVDTDARVKSCSCANKVSPTTQDMFNVALYISKKRYDSRAHLN
jgi:hypothetical protein